MSTNEYITLADATTLLPKKSGKKVHVRTVKRWIINGAHRVRLAGRKIGGQWFTTAEWLKDFEFACSQNSLPAMARTPAEVSRSQARAKMELTRRFGFNGSQESSGQSQVPNLQS